MGGAVSMEEIVYFELNNWAPGKDYPAVEPFTSWMGGMFPAFHNKEFAKENKLCVLCAVVDMSWNCQITATKEWVEDNCPELLTKYTEFLRYPDEYGEVVSELTGYNFLEYSENNIGVECCYTADED